MGRLRARAQDDGFGLIEVLLVVVLIGIITAVAVPSYTGVRDGVRNAATQSDLSSNRTAITEYSVDNNGAFPAQSGFNPRSGAGSLVGYGWSQSVETTGFHYVTNTGITSTPPTAWCLDMTNATGAVFRISTNKDIVAGSCSSISTSAF